MRTWFVSGKTFQDFSASIFSNFIRCDYLFLSLYKEIGFGRTFLYVKLYEDKSRYVCITNYRLGSRRRGTSDNPLDMYGNFIEIAPRAWFPYGVRFEVVTADPFCHAIALYTYLSMITLSASKNIDLFTRKPSASHLQYFSTFMHEPLIKVRLSNRRELNFYLFETRRAFLHLFPSFWIQISRMSTDGEVN